MLVFLTNASTPQYRLDLLNFCCYPPGAIVTVDYRRCWLSQLVAGGRPDHWVGKPLVIVYYDPYVVGTDLSVPDAPPSESPALPGEFSYYPVRYGKVVGVDVFHNSWRFLLELGDWYRYAPETSSNAVKLEEVRRAIIERIPARPRPAVPLRSDTTSDTETRISFVEWDEEDKVCPLKKEQHDGASRPSWWRRMWERMTHLVRRRVRESDTDKSHRKEAWDRFAAFFKTVPGFDDCTFVWCRYNRATKRGTGVGELPTYQLKGGSRDRVILHLVRGRNAEPTEPLIQIGPDISTIIGPVRRQHAGGIELSYDIVFKDDYNVQYALGRIVVPRRAAGGSSFLARTGRPGADVCGPEFQAELVVRPRYGALVVAVWFFMLGTFLAGVDRSVLDSFGLTRPPPSVPSDATTLLAVRIAAAGCTGIGALITLRKGIVRFLRAG